MTFSNARRPEDRDAWSAEVERPESRDEIFDGREDEPRLADARVRALEQDPIFRLRGGLDRVIGLFGLNYNTTSSASMKRSAPRRAAITTAISPVMMHTTTARAVLV